MKKFLILLGLMILTHLSYCQYPKTKIIDGEQIVLVTKKQADDINLRFITFNNTIDSQKKEINRLAAIKLDTTTISYYKTKLNECYEINRGLSKWFEETNRTAMFFDTCSYKEYKKRYKQLKEIRKNRYN